ncbi:TetR family transcriptional regulator [Phenylobacterium sp.]|jgi:AcrR family transcriptional regulator|uniref:TetR family transcriptional regulator n=1 Tax=Phenylobacterium sp. TaxID=1871053 RepID=UPI002F3F2E07
MAALRSDKRAAVAKDAMIQAAERLFGDYGLEAVSLRQIVSAAGFSNNFAVQYHFGDKAGLVSAIFQVRLAELERLRRPLLEAATRAGLADDPRTLVEIIYRPIAGLRDRDGRRAYAAFLLALQQSADGYRIRSDIDAFAPVTRIVLDRLMDVTPHVPAPLLVDRRLAASALVLTGLVQRDRQGRKLAIDDQLVQDALDTATAVITAPVADSVRSALASLDGYF